MTGSEHQVPTSLFQPSRVTAPHFSSGSCPRGEGQRKGTASSLLPRENGRFYPGAEASAPHQGPAGGPGGTKAIQLAHPEVVLGFLQLCSAGNEAAIALPFLLHGDAPGSFKERETRLKVFLISKTAL